jgi:hypothetical protein
VLKWGRKLLSRPTLGLYLKTSFNYSAMDLYRYVKAGKAAIPSSKKSGAYVRLSYTRTDVQDRLGLLGLDWGFSSIDYYYRGPYQWVALDGNPASPNRRVFDDPKLNSVITFHLAYPE